MPEGSVTRAQSESPPPSYDYLFPASSSHIRSSSNPDPAAAEDSAASEDPTISSKKTKRRRDKSRDSGSAEHHSHGLRNRLGRLRDIRITRPIYFRDQDDRAGHIQREPNETGRGEQSNSTTSQTRTRSFSPEGEEEEPLPGYKPYERSDEQPENSAEQDEQQQQRPRQERFGEFQVPIYLEEQVLYNPWSED